MWQRRLGVAWIIAFLLWLPFEDTQIWLSALLAFGACVWLGLRVLTSRYKFNTFWQAAGSGALLGAGIPLIAIALMAFKSGLHGHGFADFTTRQVWSVLSATPYGFVLGSLVGLTLHLFLVRGMRRTEQ